MSPNQSNQVKKYEINKLRWLQHDTDDSSRSHPQSEPFLLKNWKIQPDCHNNDDISQSISKNYCEDGQTEQEKHQIMIHSLHFTYFFAIHKPHVTTHSTFSLPFDWFLKLFKLLYITRIKVVRPPTNKQSYFYSNHDLPLEQVQCSFRIEKLRLLVPNQKKNRSHSHPPSNVGIFLASY